MVTDRRDNTGQLKEQIWIQGAAKEICEVQVIPMDGLYLLYRGEVFPKLLREALPVFRGRNPLNALKYLGEEKLVRVSYGMGDITDPERTVLQQFTRLPDAEFDQVLLERLPQGFLEYGIQVAPV